MENLEESFRREPFEANLCDSAYKMHLDFKVLQQNYPHFRPRIPAALFLNATRTVPSVFSGTCFTSQPVGKSLWMTTGSPAYSPPAPAPSKQHWALRTVTQHVEVEIWGVDPLVAALSTPLCPLACFTSESHNLRFWNEVWRWSERETKPSQRSSAPWHRGDLLFHHSPSKCQLSTYIVPSNS